MTISTELTKITYQANGSTTIWNFSFPAGPDPDILVFLTPPSGPMVQVTTNLQVNVNPNIDPNPTEIGGSVIYPVSGAPLAIGNRITIVRIVPLTQPTSFANQGIIYQEVIEAAIDYVVMEVQQLQEQISRSILTPITEEPISIPPCPERANKFLAFDENCKAVAVGNSNPITSTNGVRVPNTEVIPELPARPARPGSVIVFDSNGDAVLGGLPPANLQPLLGQRVTFTATHTVVNSEKGFLMQLNGNSFFDLILGVPTSYDADFSIAVFNSDVYTGPGSGRAKRVMFNGTIAPGGLLWPGQWIYVFRYGSTWVANPRDTRWKPGTQITFYVDPVLGHDDGTSDGLASGTGATKTVSAAVALANDRVDYGGILSNTGALIQLASGTYTETVKINFPTVGGLPITIQGAAGTTSPIPWIIQVPAGQYGILADNSCNVIIRGLTFQAVASANDAEAIRVSRGSSVVVDNCRLGLFPGGSSIHLHGFDSSTMNISNVLFAARAQASIVVRRQSTARLSGTIQTVAGLSFNNFLAAEYDSSIVGGASIYGDPTSLTIINGGGNTGVPYRIQYNSILNLGAGVADAQLPGNAAGIFGSTSPLHSNFGDASLIY